MLDAFGLDTRAENLNEARAFFNSRRLSEHIDHVFDMAHVNGVVMTNDPLDESEVRPGTEVSMLPITALSRL